MNCFALFLFFEEGNLLSPDVTTLVVFVTVIVLAATLQKIFFKPVLSVLDEREQRTVGTLARVRELTSECEGRLARYEQSIRDARAENYRMLEVQRKQALEERTQALSLAKAEASRLIQQAREEIAREAEDAKQSLGRESQLMARAIIASILHRPIAGTPKDQ